MFNKKQFRILIIALAVLFIVGSIYFAIRNKTQGGPQDDGTLAFTTLAGSTETKAETVPPPKPSDESGAEETEQGEGAPQEDSAETPEETPSGEDPEDDPESEPAEETPAETTGETPAETSAETTAETTAAASETAPPDGLVHENGISVAPDGEYTDKEHVALYIHAFGELPPNYITKEEAEDLGWVASLGNLWKVAPGKSIGGSHFGNYEKLLPTKKGRKYYECDIDYKGKSRGAKRIIYSNDGLIFYTSDHYESFEQLY